MPIWCVCGAIHRPRLPPSRAVGTRESAGTAVLLRGTASSLTTGSGRANNGADLRVAVSLHLAGPATHNGAPALGAGGTDASLLLCLATAEHQVATGRDERGGRRGQQADGRTVTGLREVAATLRGR